MGKKYYAVRSGREAGVFTSWAEAKAATDGYSGAVHKSFATAGEAQAFASGSGGYSASSGGRSGGQGLSSASHGGSTSSAGRSYGGGFGGGSSSTSSYSGGGGSGYGHSGIINATNAYSSNATRSEGYTKVYTDGSSRGNGTASASAGYGVYYGPNDSRNYSGKLEGPAQTNQRAELQGVVKALGDASAGSKINIHTDSAYVKNSLTIWADTWDSNGWKTSSGKPVENQDLISQARTRIKDIKASGGDVKFTKVAGHSGDPGNEAADVLANLGALK